jgi:hypothetical protein
MRMNTSNSRRYLLPLLLAVGGSSLACGAPGNAGGNGEPSLEASGTDAVENAGERTLESDAAPEMKPVYTESLLEGAELSVYGEGDSHVVTISVPTRYADGSPYSEAFQSKLRSAESALSLEELYSAWTGAARVPDALAGSVEAERKRAELARVGESQVEVDLARVPTETDSVFQEDADLTATLTLPDVNLGTAIAATPPGFDFIADANAFFATNCVTDAQRGGKFTNMRNMTWFSWPIPKRYQRFFIMNASFETSTATFIMSGVQSGRWTLGSRAALIVFVTGEAGGTVTLEALGGAPDPRVHSCVTYGGEKINSVSSTAFQDPFFDVTVRGTGFLPGSSNRLHYMHPTRGAIELGLRTNLVTTNSTFTNKTFAKRCDDLHFVRGDRRFFSQTLRITGSDGRVATTTTSALMDACGRHL